MKSTIVGLLLSCLMVLALLLVSCGSAVTEEEEEEVVTEEEEEGVAEEEEEEEEVEDSNMVRLSLTKLDGTVVEKLVEKPRYGGVVNIAMTQDVLSWDSANMSFAGDIPLNLIVEKIAGADWSRSLYGTGEFSFNFDSVPYFIPSVAVPTLGESWEAPDSETFILHLRKDVRWQDKPPLNGREFVADDLVYAFERIYSIPGSYQAAQAADYQRPVDYYAQDKYTFVVKSQPGKMGEVVRMNVGYIRIEPREVMEMYGDMKDWRNVVGTGPFILEDYVIGSSSTLVRNPNYYMKDPIHPQNSLPYLDGAKFFVIPDMSTRLAALRTGKIDLIRGLTFENWDSEVRFSPDLKWTSVIPGSSQNLWMRTDTRPFDDIRVRKALSMATDREVIKSGLYMDLAEIRISPVPNWPVFAAAFTPTDELPEDIREGLEYNPDKARQLLAEAGYPDGFQTEVVTTAGNADVLSIIKDQWEDVGVELVLAVKEPAAYSGVAYGHSYTQIVAAFHVTSQPMRGHNYWAGGAYNFAIIDDPYLSSYYETAGPQPWTIEDWEPWVESFKPVAEYELGQFWSIELPTPYTYVMWWPWLVNYGGEDLISSGVSDGYSWVKYIWLDQDLKEEMTGRR